MSFINFVRVNLVLSITTFIYYSYNYYRHENVSLQAKLGVLEGKCRELLVHQGSTVSGAAVALSALISRLDGLVEELVTSYNISDEELDVRCLMFN